MTCGRTTKFSGFTRSTETRLTGATGAPLVETGVGGLATREPLDVDLPVRGAVGRTGERGVAVSARFPCPRASPIICHFDAEESDRVPVYTLTVLMGCWTTTASSTARSVLARKIGGLSDNGWLSRTRGNCTTTAWYGGVLTNVCRCDTHRTSVALSRRDGAFWYSWRTQMVALRSATACHWYPSLMCISFASDTRTGGLPRATFPNQKTEDGHLCGRASAWRGPDWRPWRGAGSNDTGADVIVIVAHCAYQATTGCFGSKVTLNNTPVFDSLTLCSARPLPAQCPAGPHPCQIVRPNAAQLLLVEQ